MGSLRGVRSLMIGETGVPCGWDPELEEMGKMMWVSYGESERGGVGGSGGGSRAAESGRAGCAVGGWQRTHSAAWGRKLCEAGSEVAGDEDRWRGRRGGERRWEGELLAGSRWTDPASVEVLALTWPEKRRWRAGRSGENSERRSAGARERGRRGGGGRRLRSTSVGRGAKEGLCGREVGSEAFGREERGDRDRVVWGNSIFLTRMGLGLLRRMGFGEQWVCERGV